MSEQQPKTAVHEPVIHEPVSTQPTDVEADAWAEEQLEELPRRPRRRLLTPVPLALLGMLLIACGFIAGVLVEKGQTSSGSSSSFGAAAGGLAARFAALRGTSSAGSSASAGAAGGFGVGGAGASGSSGGAGGGATIGQVAYIDGSTLYVTNAEGNTVKVSTSAASTVTKTVQSEVKDIRPGETVVIMGATGSGGSIDAETIRVGGGGGGGGLGALFGGSGASGGSRGGGGPAGGGEPALFGKGG